ncbi:MAG: hypothetical protein E6J91_39410 [Deltaproteobacteria bacterium]|nr:MAG: hypothetical protein E6J91_39410 [Deltaproteobacteria bacterium]
MTPQRPTQLKLIAELHPGGVKVHHVEVVHERVVAPSHIVGPFVYQVTGTGRVLHMETMTDPLVERGFGTPKQGGHAIRHATAAVISVRIPLPAAEVPADLEVSFFRGTDAMPRTHGELHILLEQHHKVGPPTAPPGLQKLHTLSLAELRAIPGWTQHLHAAGLRDPGGKPP